MADLLIRFHWHYNSDPVMHSTDLRLPRGEAATETVIKEQIAIGRGDRCLAQYIVIADMEGVKEHG